MVVARDEQGVAGHEDVVVGAVPSVAMTFLDELVVHFREVAVEHRVLTPEFALCKHYLSQSGRMCPSTIIAYLIYKVNRE